MATKSKTLDILVVDDHKIMRDGVVAFLEYESGLEVIGEAENGQEAVDLAEQLHPDVILMDISMPVMDGLEATRRIKQHHPEIRIVMLTMFERASLARRAKEAGAAAFVPKGGSTEDLVDAIRGERHFPDE